jgi:malto-oligosyltrehalose synthase
MIPRATLRLQFHRDFTFADAEALVPYFARLGISHLYASPIAVARPGSLHGYDVIDATRVNPELGGEEGLRALATSLARAGLGLILDIVPNHMAADTANAWWADVLRHGRASAYAAFFDIDWDADDKVLLPILGRPLEETLMAGEIEIGADELRYFSHRLPLAPGEGDALARQHYRLAWWRTASDRINWRRFFDVNELVCLRMEEPQAFEAVHALPLRLHVEGLIDGLRIDHVDGLSDPAAYCRTLRRRLGGEAWLVVEKILMRGETLPRDWNSDGTTGYDFMDDVNALQHAAGGEACLAEAWAGLSGRPADFAPEEQQARREIVARSFSAQLDACAAAFATGELTPALLRRTLAELLVHFPVYRTYGVDGVLSVADRAVLQRAIDGARRTCLATDRWAVDRAVELFAGPSARPRAVARFQQLSAPVAAKSVEDTAFYRYGRLISRNDVGFDVETFSMDTAAFHARAAARAADWPRAMLATATHDHKRGEDVRARLAVLSGMAEEWAALQARWVDASAPLRTGDAPAAGDIALLLQTIVGAWPLDLDRADRPGRAAFAERLATWQQKALREAKLSSDWAAVDEAYEAAARRFTVALVADAALPAMLDEIAALVDRIAAAGAVNGLVQCLLRLTVPGIPDLYQGCEFWDFSLVDPDNRRPVDFAVRSKVLGAQNLSALAGQWRDGRIKQALIAGLLALRRARPALFSEGIYRPVTVEGARAASVVAFIRQHGDQWLLVAAPRLPLPLLGSSDAIAVSPRAWLDTALQLEALPARSLVDGLSDRSIERPSGRMKMGDLCTTLPFVLLTNRHQADDGPTL